jgi:hypothetical protein
LSLSKRSVDPDYRGHKDWAKTDVFQRSRGGVGCGGDIGGGKTI